MEFLKHLVPNLRRIGTIHRRKPGRGGTRGKLWSAADKRTAEVLGIQVVAFHKVETEDYDALFGRVAAAVGVVDDFIERSEALAEASVDALVIDIAHGDSALMLSAVRQIREHVGDVQIIAGNVATAEGTARLIDAGADAVKVGVGPG